MVLTFPLDEGQPLASTARGSHLPNYFEQYTIIYCWLYRLQPNIPLHIATFPAFVTPLRSVTQKLPPYHLPIYCDFTVGYGHSRKELSVRNGQCARATFWVTELSNERCCIYVTKAGRYKCTDRIQDDGRYFPAASRP